MPILQTTVTATTPTSPQTLSTAVPITINSTGPSVCLIVMVTAAQFGNVNSIDWDGQSMTRMQYPNGNFFVDAFFLVSPHMATGNINVNWNFFGGDRAITGVLFVNCGAPVAIGFSNNQGAGTGTVSQNTINTLQNQEVVLAFDAAACFDGSPAPTGTVQNASVQLSNLATPHGWKQLVSYRGFTAPQQVTMADNWTSNANAIVTTNMNTMVLAAPPPGLSFTVTETLSVTEISLSMQVNVADLKISVGEDIAVTDILVYYPDQVYVGEFVSIVIPSLKVSVVDSVVTSEFVSIIKGGVLPLNVFDTVTVSESISEGVNFVPLPPPVTTPNLTKHIYGRVSNPGGTFITTWSDFQFGGFQAQLNGGPGECVITLNVPFDTFTADLVEGNDVQIILSDKDTVDITIPTDQGDYFSKVLYRGYISLIERDTDGQKENVIVHLLGYYTLLATDVLKNGSTTTLFSNNASGLITSQGSQNAADVGLMARTVINRFRQENGSTKIYFNGTSDVPDMNVNAKYTFEQKTYREALDTLKGLAPSSTYWYVDPTGRLTFKTVSSTPVHTFIFGRHFTQVHVERSLEKLRNAVLVWNGDNTNPIYKKFEDTASVSQYGRRTERINDYGVEDIGGATLIGQKFLAENKDPALKVVFTIFDNDNAVNLGYNIESVQPGDTCSLIGFSSQLSDIFRNNMIITSINYQLDNVQITAELVKSSLVDLQAAQRRAIVDIGSGGLSIPATYI